MALTKKLREKLRMKFGGRCAYCGCELPEKGWHADHVQAVLRKSEQCMKAAEKRIFRLISTGD
ncbi:TPA: HNH endonuclease, partial [Escherichia coli]|nr:HNH endonuclease [Escherichia coli]